MKPYGIIYSITCIINNKKYVGQTIWSIEKRFQKHIYDSASTSNYAIHKAIRKYGIENFTVEKIDTAQTKKELDTKEQYWIFELDTFIDIKRGYNLTWGGYGPGVPSEITRKRMSDSAKKKIITKEHQAKICKSLTGKHRNKETKEKMSKNHVGNIYIYKIIFPDKTEKIIKGLKPFCLQNGLKYSTALYHLENKKPYMNYSIIRIGR